jgi:hypothetical protein
MSRFVRSKERWHISGCCYPTVNFRNTSSTPERSACLANGGRSVIGSPVLPHSDTKHTTGSVTKPSQVTPKKTREMGSMQG